MPELPEVQTIVNYLMTKIINKKVVDIQILNEKFLKNVDKEMFVNSLLNKQIIDINRKGKYLLFYLSNNLVVVNHLRMEGKFFVNKDKVHAKHDYIIFTFDDNSFLKYNDSRQFGTFHLVNKNEIDKLKELKKIAQDPIDISFDINNLINKIQKSNKNIKTILLDQTIISGIGNIYANEILFDTKINPFTKGKELTKTQIEQIWISSKKILELAIKHNGTTIQSFSFGNNHVGSFAKFLKVQSRENKNCFLCNKKIIRIKNNGRSIFYCQSCQK